MSVRNTNTLLLMGSALVAAVLLVRHPEAVADRGDLSELFDPAAVAASACGMGRRRAIALKPVQIALVSLADLDPTGAIHLYIHATEALGRLKSACRRVITGDGKAGRARPVKNGTT